MEEINVLREMFQNLIGDNVEFNITYVDKDGKKEQLNLNTKPKNQSKTCKNDVKYTNMEKALELKDKYIEQLVARLDQNNKEKIEQQKKISQNRLEYLEMCKHFADNLLNVVASFDVLINLLGFQNEEFYQKYNRVLNKVKC